MARRGRPRNAGAKRDKSGRVAKPTTKAARLDRTRVDPTPEMEAMKAAVGGLEVNSPLSYLGLPDEHREAVETYFQFRRGAGFGVSSGRPPIGAYHTHTYDPDRDPDKLKPDASIIIERSDERDRWEERRFIAADDALKAAGSAAHRSIVELYGLRGAGIRLRCTESIKAGAAALADYFRSGRRKAA